MPTRQIIDVEVVIDEDVLLPGLPLAELQVEATASSCRPTANNPLASHKCDGALVGSSSTLRSRARRASSQSQSK